MPPYRANASAAQQRLMFAKARRGEVSMADARGRARATDQENLPERVEKKAGIPDAEGLALIGLATAGRAHKKKLEEFGERMRQKGKEWRERREHEKAEKKASPIEQILEKVGKQSRLSKALAQYPDAQINVEFDPDDEAAMRRRGVDVGAARQHAAGLIRREARAERPLSTGERLSLLGSAGLGTAVGANLQRHLQHQGPSAVGAANVATMPLGVGVIPRNALTGSLLGALAGATAGGLGIGLKRHLEGRRDEKRASEWKDKLPGGLADRKDPDDFPAKALRAGEKVEAEHTSDRHLQEEIAMDHLTEDPNYYAKLKRVEKKADEFDPSSFVPAASGKKKPPMGAEDAETARRDAEQQKTYEKIWSTPRKVKGLDPATDHDGAWHPAPAPKTPPAPGKTASEGLSIFIDAVSGLGMLRKMAVNYSGMGGMQGSSTGVDAGTGPASTKFDGSTSPGAGMDNQAWSGNGYNSQIPPGGFGVGGSGDKPLDLSGYALDRKAPSAKPPEVGTYKPNK